MKLKTFLKRTLSTLHIDLTKNMQYDRLSKAIMKRILKPDSNCIDVGCFKGEILSEMLRLAPEGIHFAFEPIPVYYNYLKSRFKGKVEIFPFAISDKTGYSAFNYVVNAPAYSGLKVRKYNIAHPAIQEIKVATRPLDTLIPETLAVNLIKIDIEGGEYNALKGAKKLIAKDQPVIIFESGMASIQNYDVTPEEIFDFLHNDLNYKIWLLKHFINNKPSLSREKFIEVYLNETEYYFVAHA